MRYEMMPRLVASADNVQAVDEGQYRLQYQKGSIPVPQWE